MTDEQLTEGRNLQKQIAEVAHDLARLNDSGFYVELHQSNKVQRSAGLISTVGVGNNCEHSLAPFATAFHTAVVAHYQAQMETLKAQYAAL